MDAIDRETEELVIIYDSLMGKVDPKNVEAFINESEGETCIIVAKLPTGFGEILKELDDKMTKKCKECKDLCKTPYLSGDLRRHFFTGTIKYGCSMLAKMSLTDTFEQFKSKGDKKWQRKH